MVPAYLGQLGVIVARAPGLSSPGAALAPAAAASAATTTVAMVPAPPPARPSWGVSAGWRALPNAIAFVIGFGTVFTLLGLTLSATFGWLRPGLPLLTQLGGVLLVVLGLNLMGVLRIGRLARTWQPLDRLLGSGLGRPAPRRGIAGGLALGAVFGLAWTPCIGPTLGAILTLAALSSGPQVVALLVAYSLGLGVPFIVLALAVDRAPAITGPLVRHGHAIEVVGGGLVVVMGLAILFGWLGTFSTSFSWLWPRV